jgi:hypothetical protein
MLANSVENISSYCLLPENLNIRINMIIILSVVLCGCITWSLTEERHID